MKGIIAGRVILTFALIYGAYKETGRCTALCLFLIFGGIEGLNYLIKQKIKAERRRYNFPASKGKEKMISPERETEIQQKLKKITGSTVLMPLRYILSAAWLAEVHLGDGDELSVIARDLDTYLESHKEIKKELENIEI